MDEYSEEIELEPGKPGLFASVVYEDVGLFFSIYFGDHVEDYAGTYLDNENIDNLIGLLTRAKEFYNG